MNPLPLGAPGALGAPSAPSAPGAPGAPNARGAPSASVLVVLRLLDWCSLAAHLCSDLNMVVTPMMKHISVLTRALNSNTVLTCALNRGLQIQYSIGCLLKPPWILLVGVFSHFGFLIIIS